MEVRRIAPEEIEAFHRAFTEIIRSSFPEYPPAVLDFFVNKDFADAFLKKKIEKWDYVVWLAKEGEKIAGFLVREKLYGGVSFCTWLGVAKEFRGQGIGAKLVKAWETEVLAEKGHKLMLVAPSQEACAFYIKQGFVKEGYEKKSWFGIDYWLFGKIIAEPNSEVFLKNIPSAVLEKK